MIRRVFKIAIISLGITAVVPLGLILLDRPIEKVSNENLDFSSAQAQDLSDLPDTHPYLAGDETELPVRIYGKAGLDQPLIVMVHGSGWHGMQFNRLAHNLSAQARILVPDLRGHGATPKRRGDVDYIGQMEDDLAALIKAQALPGQKVLMLGHSSGGGLVVRFAGGAHGDMIDRAVLLAPFLKYNATTTRQDAGGWAHAMVRRIAGLSILNGFGITALNHLPVIQFNWPQNILDSPLGHTTTPSYSFRLNTGYAPRADYMKDIAALPDFAVIVGTEDEAFFADQYEPLMSQATGKGRYLLVEGIDHLAIVDAPETLAAIKEDLSGL
jgi:pimeloyl-ACP methyl ester carboxylesterase